MMSAVRFTLSARFVVIAIVLVAGATPLLAQGLPLTMSKSCNPPTVQVGTQTTVMTVTITNPNAFAVTGIGFSDTYPAGLVPQQVGAYTCTPGSALFTGSGFAFGGVTLAAGASCSVPMIMRATIAGAIVNTTSQATGTGVPPGGPASATLNAVIPHGPTLSYSMLLLLATAMAVIAAIRLRG
jgi:Domain of unknown function DUF11